MLSRSICGATSQYQLLLIWHKRFFLPQQMCSGKDRMRACVSTNDLFVRPSATLLHRHSVASSVPMTNDSTGASLHLSLSRSRRISLACLSLSQSQLCISHCCGASWEVILRCVGLALQPFRLYLFSPHQLFWRRGPLLLPYHTPLLSAQWILPFINHPDVSNILLQNDLLIRLKRKSPKVLAPQRLISSRVLSAAAFSPCLRVSQ